MLEIENIALEEKTKRDRRMRAVIVPKTKM